MAAQILISVPYALARLAVWLLLLAVAVIDGLKHRHIRSRGYQLYLALTIVCALFTLKNIVYLAISLEAGSEDGAATAAYIVYIFFSDLAEGLWIGVLLAISAGYCITRKDFGPHKTVVLLIPTIFFATALVVDYVQLSVFGKDVFSSDYYDQTYDENYDPTTDTLEPTGEVTATTGVVFGLCAVANAMAFILAWFYMYDTARAEWEALTQQPVQLDGDAPLPGTRDSSSAVGHTAVPNNAVLLEAGQNASHLYGDVTDRDLDAPKNVAERIEDRDKARLMRQFFVGVSIYIIAAILVFFLPAFVPMGVGAALVIGYDVVLICFLAGLLFVFRMRESNQYLNLTEEGGIDGPEMTTELGVLQPNEHSNNNNSREQRPSAAAPWPRVGAVKTGAVPAAAAAPQPRFTLEDDDISGSDDADAYEPLESMDINPPVADTSNMSNREVVVEEEEGSGSVNVNGVVVKPLQNSE